MRLRLPKFQNNDVKAQELRFKKLLEKWEDIEDILHYQGFF